MRQASLRASKWVKVSSIVMINPDLKPSSSRHSTMHSILIMSAILAQDIMLTVSWVAQLTASRTQHLTSSSKIWLDKTVPDVLELSRLEARQRQTIRWVTIPPWVTLHQSFREPCKRLASDQTTLVARRWRISLSSAMIMESTHHVEFRASCQRIAQLKIQHRPLKPIEAATALLLICMWAQIILNIITRTKKWASSTLWGLIIPLVQQWNLILHSLVLHNKFLSGSMVEA